MTRKGLRRLFALGLAAVVGVGALGVVYVVRQQAQAARLKDARAEGMRLYEADELEAAFDPLNRYVSAVKDDPEALLAFARCRLAVELPNNRHVMAALAAAKLANEIAPDDPEPLEFMLAVLSAANRQTETLDTCLALLAIDPAHPGALALRVRALTRLGRTDEAIEAADEFIGTRPDDLNAYHSRVFVLIESGGTNADADAYLRSEPVAARLANQPLYHLRAASSAASCALESDRPADRSASFARALTSVRRALALGPSGPAEALEATGLLRRLGVATGDDSLGNEADRAIDAIIESGAIGDAYAAAESRRAWWRLDDPRSAALASNLDPGSDDGVGWLAFVDGIGSPAFDRLGTLDTPHARYWRAVTQAAALANEGATPAAVRDALESADRDASTLDNRPGLRDHSHLMTLILAQSYRQANQFESAKALLQDACPDDPENASPNAATPRSRGRLYAVLAAVYADLDETERAAGVLALLDEQGVDPNLARGVVSGFFEARLRQTGTGDARDEATRQLESVSALAAGSPDDPSLAALHARLLLLAGRRAEGLAEAERLLGLGAPSSDADLASLARLVWPDAPSLTDRLLGLAGPADASSLPIVLARAEAEARRSGPDAGLAIIDDAGAHLDGAEYDLQRAFFLETHGLAGATAAFAAASEKYPEAPGVQTTVLGSRAAWDDQAVVRRAVARLREATGEDALEWRAASLRADLRYIDDLESEQRGSELSRITLELRRLSDRTPDNTAILRLVAVAYDTAGSPDEAARALRKAAARDPAYAPELIRLLVRERRTAEANEALDALSAADGTALPIRLLRERAELLEALGRSEEAVDDRRSLARSGALEDIAAYGVALAAAGRADEAREQARTLFEAGDSADAAASGVRILTRAGRPGDAVEPYLAARVPIEGEAVARATLARIFVGLNAWDRAIEQARTAAEFESDPDSDLALIVVHASLESGRIGEAVETVSTAPEDRRVLRALRTALVDQRDGVRLARALAAIQLSPSDGDLAETLTAFLLGEIDRSAALQTVRAISERNPTAPWPWRALAELARLDGDAAHIDACEQAASALRNAAWPLYDLALTHLRLGDLQAAERAANRLADRLGREPFDADAIRGRIAALQGDWQTALTWLLPHRDRIASGDSTELDALVLARAMTISGRANEAEAILDRRVGATPAARGLFVDAAMDLPPDDTERMRRWLTRATDADGAGADLVATARAWAELSRRSESGADAERAKALFERAGIDRLGMLAAQDLASVEIILGDLEAAERRLAALAEEHPDEPMLLNNYAYLLATEFGKPEAAVGVARGALRSARDAGYPAMALGVVGHTLSAAQRAAGDTEAAEATLRTAIRDAGPFADATIELAEILLERGALGEAREVASRIPRADRLSPSQRQRADAIQEELR
jgi:Tfp pilus assembly protein PilF